MAKIKDQVGRVLDPPVVNCSEEPIVSVLFDGFLEISYSQAYVLHRDTLIDPHDAYRDQSNGLLGCAVEGSIFLTFGVQDGSVPFEVLLFEAMPPVEDEWHEIVEGSLRVRDRTLELVQWAGEATFSLGLPPGWYRARYCIRNMGAAMEANDALEANERYLLSFWPAQPEPDRILRQTSEAALYWHACRKTE